MISYQTIPALQTQNLILRSLRPEDKEDLFQIRSDARMHLFTDTEPDGSIDETERYIRKMLDGAGGNLWLIWAMEHKETHRVIGSASIWNFNEEHTAGELGFGILPAYQGKGLMKEALARVVSFGFDACKMTLLEAYTEELNIPARKLLERLGFWEQRNIAEKGNLSDRVFRMIVYRLNKERPSI